MRLFAWLCRSLLLSAAIMAVLLFGCGDDNGAGSGGGVKFTDVRDGRTYKTVSIGGTTWMAENLNMETADSWCYNDSQANCTKYGRLYTWVAAKTACPTGWYLPSRQDWENLGTTVGGYLIAGKKLKSKRGWNKNGNGTDDYGFSALPGGRRSSDGYFGHVGDAGLWWTATEYSDSEAYRRSMHNYQDVSLGDTFEKGVSFSVRCVQDL
jgi:uncharacterized protein (TIGR02145 family)